MALIREWKMRCLICMKDVPAEIPVFGSQGQRKNLRRMMTEYLNFTPRENENEPKNMCESCYDTLQKVNDLKGYANETKQNIRLVRNFYQRGSEEQRVEAIRLWLSSQRMQHSSGQQQQPPPLPPTPPPPPSPPPQQQPPSPPPQQQPPPPPPPPQQQQQQPPLPLQRDFTHSSSSSSSSSSSISTNEATGSIALNISAVVSENSDARSRTQSVSSTAARQERSQRVLHHRGRKRPGTPLPFSTPSRRSRSLQPGTLPPESSRKQHLSAARSLKTRKIAVQQNGDHSGSPRPGSRPPETAHKSSVSRKRSATKREERVEFHRAQSVSPVRGNSCNASTRGENKRQRGRPRSKSLPPSKCRKMFDQAERDCKSRNETASKPTPWKPYLDDDICFGRITTSCDLKEFKKHIPFVKLQRVKVPTTPSTEKKIPKFPFPESQRSTMSEFTELRARQPPQREHQQHGPGKHLMMGTSEFPKHVKLVQVEVKDGIVQQFCWICNKTFPSIENLEQHLVEHVTKNRPGPSSSQDVTEPTRAPSFFACNLCGIQFASNGFLQRHMMNHSEKKWSHKCGVCEETFQTSAILKRHMGNHNISGQVSTTTTQDATCHEEEKEKEVEVEEEQEQVVEQEEQEQPREQVYACSCCLQEFTSEQALGKHMLQHRKCTLCNKAFRSKDELAAHVGECHKVCDICDEAVIDEEALQFHIENSHEKCNLCGEQFLFEEELSAHLNTHPYRCLMCFSAFNDKVQRIEHIKLTHPDMLELLIQTFAKEKTTV